MEILCKEDYENNLAQTRDSRMKWWREARYGMFVHIGLFSVLAHHEWAFAAENWDVDEYEKLANDFNPKVGSPREWAKLAKRAGMKYMVLTTRHHEGFSLWDSKANPFNSVNYGPKRDIVREFVDACHEFDLGVGFYSSLMDWHHPDGGSAAYDSEARKRFNDYIFALNKELLTNYGKIDILWYDVSNPMKHFEGWNSLELNQKLREIQPEIIINNRSKLDEDFGTPEEHVTAEARDWEACMTFNGLSWGYVDSKQAAAYSYNAQRILNMLNTATAGSGNLLLNIGPKADGTIPEEVIEPLETVGKWLAVNGEAVYGKVDKSPYEWCSGLFSASVKGNKVYLWNRIWPTDDVVVIGGFSDKLVSAKILTAGENLTFKQEKYRIYLDNTHKSSPDEVAGVAIIELEFEKKPEFVEFAACPALHSGKRYM